ncbi:22707_t:CDS:1, partial [Gigaspora margarita]
MVKDYMVWIYTCVQWIHQISSKKPVRYPQIQVLVVLNTYVDK